MARPFLNNDCQIDRILEGWVTCRMIFASLWKCNLCLWGPICMGTIQTRGRHPLQLNRSLLVFQTCTFSTLTWERRGGGWGLRWGGGGDGEGEGEAAEPRLGGETLALWMLTLGWTCSRTEAQAQGRHISYCDG